MKFVFITDTHIKEKNPINRLDNYFETVINKIDEAAHFAVENKVNFIVHGGDLFDTPTVSTICLVKFNRILFYLKENNIKFY
ncbi:metallophosphoesterase, partial [uncultured Fenollaria sp.]|uniref:metallophosphoesterase n=1 Tax=uncultured Fenollaria sp. TaxID=1686315 RepID=UPI0025F2DE0F